jgi:hypothetical protein
MSLLKELMNLNQRIRSINISALAALQKLDTFEDE